MNQILLRTNVESRDQQDNYSAVAVWVGAPQDTTLLHSLAQASQFFPLRD
jgi:hypothetical protein